VSSLVPSTSFAQGASGEANVFDTSPAGLGMNPSYLAGGASASASASISTSLLTGRIASGGGITAGTGFTVSKGATGLYTINFSTAFIAVPVVLLTPGPSGADLTAVLNAVSTTAFTAFLLAVGSAADEPFHFLVVATQ
jgi:hypothetical protein